MQFHPFGIAPQMLKNCCNPHEYWVLGVSVLSQLLFLGLTQKQAQTAWMQFERMCANDLQLLPVEVMMFHKAALLIMDATAGLRAGDALHLACALQAKAKGMVTLDIVLAKNAKRFKVQPVAI